MQVTIDIPAPMLRELEAKDESLRTSIERLVLESAAEASAQVSRPTFVSMNLNLNDFMFMTDDEYATFGEAFNKDPEAAVRQFGIRRLDDAA